MTRDAVRRALRTFIITTLALFVPGLLGWLNALTEWARGEGSTPFPDAHGLAYLAVSAITAGVVALINLLWNVVEDALGKGLLRTVPSKPARPEDGAASLRLTLTAAVAIWVVFMVLCLLL
jgi:predicted secreted protein